MKGVLAVILAIIIIIPCIPIALIGLIWRKSINLADYLDGRIDDGLSENTKEKIND